jgi:uncharacterized membrane protein
MSTKKQQERKKFWIRVICVVLALLMIGSTLVAALGLF